MCERSHATGSSDRTSKSQRKGRPESHLTNRGVGVRWGLPVRKVDRVGHTHRMNPPKKNANYNGMASGFASWRVNWGVEMKNAPEGASLLGTWRPRRYQIANRLSLPRASRSSSWGPFIIRNIGTVHFQHPWRANPMRSVSSQVEEIPTTVPWACYPGQVCKPHARRQRIRS
jgi:hypothetical protein